MDNRQQAADQVAYLREMADATFALADRCRVPALVAPYIAIATQWLRLASEAEQEMRALPPEPQDGTAT